MTFTEKSHTTPNYYISMEFTVRHGTPVYIVRACPIFGGICGHPERETAYPASEKKKAAATFSRYKRKYI